MCEGKSQDYHEAIKNVVEHLKSKRNELVKEINNDEVEKARVVGEMDRLKDKLCVLEANLKMKSEFRKDYDKAISQSEGHFVELMQKSEDFLLRARREALALSQAIGEKSGKMVADCRTCEPKPENGCPQESENKPEIIYPAAVVSFQAGDSGNCVNCSNYACTTIAVPYRANGL